MDNKTKILLGIGLAGIAYLIWKNKFPKNTASVGLPVEKIDEQIKKEVPATPSNPETPETPATPASPSPASPDTPSTPAAPVIPVIPPFDFDQYFKDHPIVIDIDPNVGSTMVVNPPAYGNADPFAKYQNCITLAKYFELKNSGVYISPDVCIENTGNPISAKDMENAFKMRDVQNELSRDAFGDLNAFMTASDVYYIGGWAGGESVFPTTGSSGGSGGGSLSEAQRDLFRMGYGGDFSG